MEKALKIIIVITFVTVVITVAVVSCRNTFLKSPEVKAEETRQRVANLRFYCPAKRILFVAVPGVLLLSVLVATSCLGAARIRKASVFLYRIGKHSIVPVHHKHIKSGKYTDVMLILANAEQLRYSQQGQEKALNLYMSLADVQHKQLKTLKGVIQLPKGIHAPDEPLKALPGASVTVQGLLRDQKIGQGNPLYFGSETRQLSDLKSLAVAGGGGSGKTLSLAYLISCCVVNYQALALVIDPHHGHPESLTSYLQPFVASQRVCLYNPFDVEQVVEKVDAIIDRRLSGELPSTPTLLFVIDELVRLAKLPVFDKVFDLIDRLVTETRKTNIIFFCGSVSWSARHFKQKADFRQVMNSSLIHRVKPEQAGLLIEGKEKRLIKQVKQKGEALLCTDFGDICHIRMPYITRHDFHDIANLLHVENNEASAYTDLQALQAPAHRQPTVPELTPELSKQRRKALNNMSLDEVVQQAGLKNKMQLSRYEHGKSELTHDEKQRVLHVYFSESHKVVPLLQKRG